MKISPLWIVCIAVRIILIVGLRFLTETIHKQKFVRYLIALILLTMGSGFMYKGFTGSNNEIQIAKVFWHETRYVHGALYLLSSYYILQGNIDMVSLVLVTDVFFSFLYRGYTNQ